MKNKTALLLLLMVLTAGVLAAYQGAGKTQSAQPGVPAGGAHVTVTARDLKWTPLFLGLETAVVSGDPAMAGAPFVMRVRATKAAAVPAHWHPMDENVTVLTGTIKIGVGERYDAKAAPVLAAGTYTLVPKDMRHYAWHAAGSVIQIHGTGPFELYFVNPAEDPRKAVTK